MKALTRAMCRWLGVVAWIGLGTGMVPGLAQGPVAPEMLPYQGTLVNGDGNPLGSTSPKNYDVIFRIYDAAANGTLLWAEQQTVTVDAGRYSVQLGLGGANGTEPRPALVSVFRSATASDRYVEVTVKSIGPGGGDSTLIPRTRLLPGAFAMVSRHALSTDRVVNSGNASVITLLDTKVGINTTNPTVELTVKGGARATAVSVTGNVQAGGKAKSGSWVGKGASPVGTIILWSGTAVDKPAGWALCDGTEVNGLKTPDLRGRFILGAGAGPGLTERRVGQTGGEEAHALTLAEMPSHDHVVDPPATRTGVSGGHAHRGFMTEIDDSNLGLEPDGYTATGNLISWGIWNVNTTTTPAHRHTVNFSPKSSEASGRGLPLDNMPPFYVLAYLIRVQ